MIFKKKRFPEKYKNYCFAKLLYRTLKKLSDESQSFIIWQHCPEMQILFLKVGLYKIHYELCLMIGWVFEKLFFD